MPTDPDALHLSLRLPETGETLRRESDEAAHRLALCLAAALRSSRAYCRLAGVAGEICAALFVEKQLFESLLPVVRCGLRRRYLQSVGDPRWRAPIRVADPSLAALAGTAWPWPEIGLEARRANGRTHLHRIGRRFRDRLVGLLRPRRIEGPSRLGIELIEGVAQADHRNELLWWDPAALPAERLFGLNVFNTVFDGQRRCLTALQHQGGLFAARYRRQARLLGVPHLPVPSALAWGVRSGRTHPSDWLANHVPSWLHAVGWWERLFRRYNIRLWISVNESGVDAIAQRAAMDRTGGLTLFRQRSEYTGYPDSIGLMPAHVALVWNDATVGYLARCRNRNLAVAVTGHTMGAAPGPVSAASQRLRGRLRRHGARFVVAFFDALFLDHNAMRQEEVAAVYRALCQRVLERPDFGVLFKPKKPWAVTGRWAMSEALTRAEATGRAIVLKDPTLLPRVVSAAADLTAGVGISSAVLEANIAGYRGVHFHSGHAGSHCFERFGMERLVFDTLPALLDAIDRVYAGRGGDIGRSGALTGRIDRYADGKGPERMRRIVHRLLEMDLRDRSVVVQAICGALPDSESGASFLD